MEDHPPQPGQVQAARDEADPAVRMVDADPTWPARFAAEAASSADGPLPTGAGRPWLPAHPYPDADGVVRYPFFGKPPTRPRAFHIHVAQAGSDHERRHLAVRDFLRAHPDQARGYERVKRAAAARHPGDRAGYMAAKQAFVDDLERRRAGLVRPAAVSRMTWVPRTRRRPRRRWPGR